MSMNVEINSINLLTKIVIDCCLIVDININFALNIKNLKINDVNLINLKIAKNKSIINEFKNEKKSEIERNF